jgi:outer membrane protein OmpA-like peptidoglycan-associated protein
VASKEWTLLGGTYVATGGERYITLGCFNRFIDIKKVIAPNTNDSHKAYYYIDDVGLVPAVVKPEEMIGILSGACFQLNNLNFETDKAVILEGSFAELKSLTSFLKTYPYITVYIDGHTDKTGTNAHNEKLSEERALAVKAYLIIGGIDGGRLNARSYGEDFPIDRENDNSLENRRVEITVCAAK